MIDPEERLKQIQKEIAIVGIIDSPGAILLGLGLYAKFEAKGNAFIDILNNGTVVNIMLVAGAAILAWGINRVISLSKKSAKIRTTYNL